MKSLNEQVIRKIKLRYLHFIDVICDTQSLVAAASRLNVTPAALSKSCIEIEKILGVQLFVRSHQGMQPTEICLIIVESSRAIKYELDKLVTAVNEHKETEFGTLLIGVQAMGLEKRIMQGVSVIKRNDPSRTIRLVQRERSALIDMLNRRELDMIFVDSFQMDRQRNVSFFPMLQAGSVVISAQGVRPVRDIVEDWMVYRDNLWILPQKGFAIRDRFESVLYSRDLDSPRQIIEYNSSSGLRDLFTISGGFGIIPTYALSMAKGYVDVNIEYETMEEMRLESGLAWLGASPHKKYVQDAIAVFTSDELRASQ
ncbi:LysR family transcriptional regulator [Asaia sp. BMEF1]|uniref:LysR family transcriptional regulator n=1 Tax=Asaia sp. BMEF1 TaxID=3155932 RepID=UPI003F669EEE